MRGWANWFKVYIRFCAFLIYCFVFLKFLFMLLLIDISLHVYILWRYVCKCGYKMLINTLCFNITLLTYLIYTALLGFTYLSSLRCSPCKHIIVKNCDQGLGAVFRMCDKDKGGVRDQVLRHKSRWGVRIRLPGIRDNTHAIGNHQSESEPRLSICVNYSWLD